MRHPAALALAICAALATASGALVSVIAYQRAVMPYNREGNYFDGIANYHDGAQFVYGVIAMLAFVLAGCLAWLAYRLTRKA